MTGVVSGNSHQTMLPPRRETPRSVGFQLSQTIAAPGCM